MKTEAVLTSENRAAGCYGIWLNREAQAVNDLTWTESIYIMFNSIEITLYTVGGSLTVFSRYFISRAAAYSSGARTDHSHSNSNLSGVSDGRILPKKKCSLCVSYLNYVGLTSKRYEIKLCNYI